MNKSKIITTSELKTPDLGQTGDLRHEQIL